MKTCPDCTAITEQVKNNNRYEIIDIGEHVRFLKEFLRLRENNSVFTEARKKGYVGIPCFVLENGTVTLNPEEAGLQNEQEYKSSCNIDGSGCQRKELPKGSSFLFLSNKSPFVLIIISNFCTFA